MSECRTPSGSRLPIWPRSSTEAGRRIAGNSAENGGGGNRSRESTNQQGPTETISREAPGTSGATEGRQEPARTDDCSNVVSAHRLAEQDTVADQLEAVRLIWLRTGDEKTLRRTLLDILRQLEESGG